MTLSIVDKALLRRLIVGDLRSDGVTDYQRHCLYDLAEQDLVAVRFLPLCVQFSITDAGRSREASCDL